VPDQHHTHTDAAWLSQLAGRFIVFEGPDGSGKSTQFRRLSDLCTASGLVVCEVREPGGTPVGEKIREVLLDRAHTGMGVRCETLLYMASRAELVERRILPALSRGELVLADRFVASTLAYQGAAGGVPTADIAAVARVATRGMIPDLNIVLDLDEVTAAGRLSPLLDRMEAKGAEFHRAVRRGYHEQVRSDPRHYIAIDASRPPDEVWTALLHALRDRVPTLPAPRSWPASGATER